MTAAELQRELRREALPWAVFEAGDGHLRAERLGSHKREVAHANPMILLDLVRDAEERLNPMAVEIDHGLANL